MGEDRITIRLGAGTYAADGINTASLVSLEGSGSDATTIRGTMHGLRTGATLSRVLVEAGSGAGVHVGMGESPRILRCRIRHNAGDGICIAGRGTPVVQETEIRENALDGIHVWHGGAIRIEDCTIADNRISGIRIEERTSLEAARTTIAGHTASAIRASGESWTTLDACALFSNRSFDAGAGLYLYPGSRQVLTNCLIHGNADGGLMCWDSDTDLVNCTIADNDRGGIFTRGAPDLRIRNTIIWGNRGESLRGTADVSFTIVEGQNLPGTANATASPLFAAPASYDYQALRTVTFDRWEFQVPDTVLDRGDYGLLRASAAIDSGAPEGAPPRDLAGTVRPCWEGIDRGCLEYCGSVPPGLFAQFVRGDANQDGFVDISDAAFVLRYLFRGGPISFDCKDAGDADDNGKLEVTDSIVILRHLFLGALPPANPFAECGVDPTEDALDCASYRLCSSA